MSETLKKVRDRLSTASDRHGCYDSARNHTHEAPEERRLQEVQPIGDKVRAATASVEFGDRQARSHAQ